MIVSAPHMSATPPTNRPRFVELPRLRWARCDDTLVGEGGQVPSHAHDEPELVLCTKGRIFIEAAGLSLEGRPGDLYVLPARVAHVVRSDGKWENLCALYAGGESLLATAPRTIDVRAAPRILSWFEDLCRLHEAHPRTSDPVADSLMLAVLLRVAELEDRALSMRSLHPRVASAIDYLHERPAARLTAADLARASGASYSHLSALFRKQFGCGPLEYHRMQRIQRAQALLADPYVSVGEVARRLGFEDVNYFVRLFRKSCGTSPGRWRKGRVE